MSLLLNLPTSDSSKFIVVDEGVDVAYAENLIIAWLQVIRKKDIETPINFLLFSTPKYCLQKQLLSAHLPNVHIQDYYNIDFESEEIDVYQSISNFVNQCSNTIFVVDCLCTLSLQIGVAKACKFIEKLCRNYKSQVFCIYRRDFYQNIPRIETLGNVYVKLNKTKKLAFESNIHYEVSITHKKVGGSVAHWEELVKQNIETFSIESEKISNDMRLKMETQNAPEVAVKPQSTFRLEMSEREIKQRDSVPLPYILPGNPGGESKIIYVPDDADDLDEEDPDDDLDI